MRFYFITCCLVLNLFLCPMSISGNYKITAQEVVSNHLDSIGTKENRFLIKGLIAVGNVSVTLLSTKNLPSQGRLVIASTGKKMFWGFINANEYPFERFSFDGDVAKVAYVRPGTRSILGNFIISNKGILDQSILGGVISSSWSLSDLENNKATLYFEGKKN